MMAEPLPPRMRAPREAPETPETPARSTPSMTRIAGDDPRIAAAVAGDRAAAASLLAERLAQVLDGLPDAQRQALVLHHVVGMSVPELAAELGVSFDTAKSRLRLGMERLRKHYLGGRDEHG